jgi:peptidase M28-like protein/PA domain-containing protein
VPRWFVRGLVLFVVIFAAVALLVAAHHRRDDGDETKETPAPRRQADTVGDHLRALQQAADEGGGTRAAGTAGDRATAEYVGDRLRAAGYRVSVSSFEVPFYRETRPPRVVVDGRPLKAIRTLQFSPGGRASGRIRPVGLGCTAGEFAALQPGEIALADRGDCFFFLKAQLARQAGATALLVVNDGPKPPPGSLFRPGRGIPVVGLSKRAGAGLAGKQATVAVDAESGRRETSNLVAEIGPEDAGRVVMAGAHRDSVPAGPGMNDDGSGVVALLTMAERFPASRLPRDTALRLGFWGGEELGLLGSRQYVRGLSDAERRRIKAYVNLDMVASPGEKVAVYDTNDAIESTFRKHLPPKAPQVDLEGDSDHASFERGGIPAGGIFTGLDDCYHQPCDTIDNVDRAVLATSIRATEATLLDLLRG